MSVFELFRMTASVGRALFLTAVCVFFVSDRSWSVAKVYLLNGETRLGSVLVRDGRVTINATDRLYQHPIEAIQRIDQVTGETTLVASDILLREKPEPFSKNLASIPMGCEVRILDHNGQWTRVEVNAGRSKAEGYVHDDDLSDSVFFAPADPTIQFKAPPPSRQDRFNVTESLSDPRGPGSVGALIEGADETGFNRLLFDRLWGSSLEDILKQREILRANEENRKDQEGVDGDTPATNEGEPGAGQSSN